MMPDGLALDRSEAAFKVYDAVISLNHIVHQAREEGLKVLLFSDGLMSITAQVSFMFDDPFLQKQEKTND